jgi:hypothetical protein
VKFRYRVTVPLKRFFTESLNVTLGGPHGLVVELDALPGELSGEPGHLLNVLCTAQGEWEASPVFVATLEAIAQNRLPDELKGAALRKIERGSWLVLDGVDVPFEILPEGYLTTVEGISQELSGAIHRTVKLFAWRFALEIGPRSVVSALGSEWSRDGATWNEMASPVYAHVTTRGLPQLTDRHRREVQNLLEIDAHEPFAHELLREARSLGGTPEARTSWP